MLGILFSYSLMISLVPRDCESIALRRMREEVSVDRVAQHLGVEPSEISGIFDSTNNLAVFTQDRIVRNCFSVFPTLKDREDKLREWIWKGHPTFQGRILIVVGPEFITKAKNIVSDSGDLLLIQISSYALKKICSPKLADAMMTLTAMDDEAFQALNNGG